jgi:hypothetical protein
MDQAVRLAVTVEKYKQLTEGAKWIFPLGRMLNDFGAQRRGITRRTAGKNLTL